MSQRSLRQARIDLHAGLHSRLPEIEDAVLARVFAVSESPGPLDPEYAKGLRAAVCAAIDHCLAAVELGEERSPLAPHVLLAQVRLAARNGVSLDTVLNCCFAGHTLIADFLVEEAERGGLLSGDELQRLLRVQTTVFDGLLAAVSEEHARATDSRVNSAEQRDADRVERLLAGELLDTSQLAYDFRAHHLGVIASGSGAREAVRQLAIGFDRRLLVVDRGEDTVWAWLGGRRPIDPSTLQTQISTILSPQVSLAVGEPAKALTGWRLTHQQARAALSVALRSSNNLIRYADVALLASVLEDDLLATSLRQLYLTPLEAERDGGRIAKETLRAYFAAERNVASAAAALGVKRHTVTSRLRTIEKRVGRSLDTCALEINTALRLEDLGSQALPFTAFSRT